MVLTVLVIIVLTLAVLAGCAYWIDKARTPQEEKTASAKDGVDMTTPLEDLHRIIRRQYIKHPKYPDDILAQVECICGWKRSSFHEANARRDGDSHVKQKHDDIARARDFQHKLDEAMIKNQQSDFAF